MKITIDMIGKKIIRTGRNKENDGSFSDRGEELANVTQGLFYLKSKHGSEPYPLKRCDWDDDKWELYEPHKQKCICDRCPKCGGTV